MHERTLSEQLAATVESMRQSLVRVVAGRYDSISGFAWQTDGAIISSSHLLDEDEAARIVLFDGRETTARIVGRDSETDVVLLKTDQALKPPTWASTPARLGEITLGLGFYGSQLRASFGVIALLGGEYTARTGRRIDPFIVPGFEPQPGYSGGLLVRPDGSALGMNTTALVRRGGVTIPHATLSSVVSSLERHGKIRRAFLGMGGHPARLPEALAKLAGQEAGLIVVSLKPSGPSERAGLLLGDVVLSVGGRQTESIPDLFEALAEDRVGQSVPIELLRAGKRETIQVTPGERL